jgi:hypothetical protein
MSAQPLQISPKASRLRACWLHVLLLAIIGVECLAAWINHRSDGELHRILDNGAPKQKVHALFVLTNRDTPQLLDQQSVRRILKSDDALLREWTMTANFTRQGPSLAQEAHIMSLGRSPAAIRCQFFLNYRPAVGSSPTLSDLRRFLDALGDGS